MFDRGHIQKAKLRTMVQIETMAGKSFVGEVFVAQGERLADVLNDSRGFLPLLMADGQVSNIAKSTVAMASVVAEQPQERTDPYKYLRIQRGASFQEVRSAWMKRLKACHPDLLASMDLDEEIIYTARRVSQKLNDAYDAIVSELKVIAAKKAREQKRA